MSNPELCKEVLETILNIQIDYIEYPQLDKTLEIYPDSKGIRLDLYVKDYKKTCYSIEMQAQNIGNLSKRSRNYQSVMDVDALLKGEYYSQLKVGYVIFICTFDPFGEGRHLYIFQNTCQENKDLLLGDYTNKIFLNTKGKLLDVNEKVLAF